MPNRLVSFVLVIALQLLSGALWAQPAVAPQLTAGGPAPSEQFLPPDQAFKFSYQQQGEQVRLHWQIAPGYYLYQKRLKISDAQKKAYPFEINSVAEDKEDPNFGLVKVFHDQLALSLVQPALTDNRIIISYQGCSEDGLCYPPKHKTVTFSGLPSAGMMPVGASSRVEAATQASAPASMQAVTMQAATMQTATLPGNNSPLAIQQDAGAIASLLANAEGYWVIVTFLVLGLGLTFTPCVLPMVPILAGIIAGQGAQITLRKGIGLSVAYVLGMSVTYTIAGVLVGFFGARMNLQASLQSPSALLLFAGLFTALALSMFGFYELQLPSTAENPNLVIFSRSPSLNSSLFTSCVPAACPAGS
ncbi:MAG: protein-disulfide reductase DsbD domain-containing protein [Motiliproteus sp.]